ncbi:MAG TPA: MOSC domain-containing protein [Blastocatellia bacterium]|jgi:MOSC domain-containing protein YiiM
MSEIQLLSIQVGLPQVWATSDVTGSGPVTWTTAFLKQPATGLVWVGKTNIDGDQAGAKTHGGPEKVVCVYPWEHYSYWQREMDLPALTYGAFAENFTVRGQLEYQACIGDTFRIGEVDLQISQPRPPCWRLARWWQRKDFAARMEETGRTGWYCRVMKEGYVEAGMGVETIERPYPEWTISLANHLLYGSKSDLDRMEALASCGLLSDSWREILLVRKAKLKRAD